MPLLAVPFSLFLIGSILLEAFESLVLPRRIERRFRLTRVFYRRLWAVWRKISHLLPDTFDDTFLSYFGPLSLLLLLTVWGCSLVFGFSLLEWGLSIPLHPASATHLGDYLYLSATTFVTLGYGDLYPASGLARFLCDTEAGLGFGFLAIVIGYLPVLYGAFSQREVEIAMLDARASSPPSAGEMLRRTAVDPENSGLREMLRDYERWSAELLESHLSFPVLMYYRSQHDRQSWLSALTTILDTSAFIVAVQPDEKIAYQARMTFAMARHAAIDLALTFDKRPTAPERLSAPDYAALCEMLVVAGMPLRDAASAPTEARLRELRNLYEPYIASLAQILAIELPTWLPVVDPVDNWQTSGWDRDDHFFQHGKPTS